MSTLSAEVPKQGSPLNLFWLTVATLLAIAIIGYNQQWVAWFVTRFPDHMAIGAAAFLSSVIAIIGFKQILPTATAFTHEKKALGMLLSMRQKRTDYVQIVQTMLTHPFAGEFGNTATAKTIADLHGNVTVAAAVNTTPTLGINEIYGGFAGRLAVYQPRLLSSVQLLVALGLLGTITGFVATFTSQDSMPATLEESKTYLFLLYKGMGMVYVSAILAWGGAAWLYLFEKSIARNVDDLCDAFWSLTASLIEPVIKSKQFSEAVNLSTLKGAGEST